MEIYQSLLDFQYVSLTGVPCQAFIVDECAFDIGRCSVGKVIRQKERCTAAQIHNLSQFTFEQTVNVTVVPCILLWQFVDEQTATLLRRILLDGRTRFNRCCIQFEKCLRIRIDQQLNHATIFLIGEIVRIENEHVETKRIPNGKVKVGCRCIQYKYQTGIGAIEFRPRRFLNAKSELSFIRFRTIERIFSAKKLLLS